jgi:hypothetical protein
MSYVLYRAQALRVKSILHLVGNGSGNDIYTSSSELEPLVVWQMWRVLTSWRYAYPQLVAGTVSRLGRSACRPERVPEMESSI